MTNSTRGFTLIEMMIVIAIIVLLAGLTLGISNKVLRGSEIRKTKDAITLLDTAISEWETEMDRSITFASVGAVGGNYDIPSDGILGIPVFNAAVDQEDMYEAMDSRSEELWELLIEFEASKNILAKIHPDLIEEDEHGARVIDAWGSPIGIVFPCGDFEDSGLIALAQDASGDLTVRDQAEDGLGSCLNKRAYLVSAGPDGLWGYRYQANPYSRDDETWNATLDNVTSYEPFVVEDAR
ncbi:MAG: type II secretion system protein [Planctomycetes bacterium]|nr:type II secretion system protein [Planctomycetota bacterium]